MPDALRILHVVRRYAPMRGGTERYVEDVATAQARLGHRVRVVTLDRDVVRSVPGRLPQHELRGGVDVIRLPGAGGAKAAMTWRPDRAAALMREAHVVHLHDLRFLFATGLVASIATRTPLVLHTHGLIFHTPWAEGLKRVVIRGAVGPALRATRAIVIAGSEPDRDRLLILAPYLEAQVRLFENAIDVGRLSGLVRKPEPGLLLTVGRVASSKGIDRLLRALARTPMEWRLEVAGPAPPAELRALSALAARLGIAERVRFSGAFSNERLPRLLARAQVAVFPSRGEGFGLALLEAMAAGVPVLASAIPAHEALLGSKLAARLVDFDDASAAAGALAAAMAEPQPTTDALGELERERASRFDIPRLVAQIDQLYVEMGLRGAPQRS